MDANNLMFDGEEINLVKIKERHKKIQYIPYSVGKHDFMVFDVSYRLFNRTNAGITNGRS